MEIENLDVGLRSDSYDPISCHLVSLYLVTVKPLI